MTAFMEPPYEYARSHRAAGFIDCRAYDGTERLEKTNPAALKKSLSGEDLAAPERCRDACLDRQDMYPEAMFLAVFSISRELL